MIEQQYQTIMEIHSDWLDKAIEEVARAHGNQSMDTQEFTNKIQSRHDVPDGLQTLPHHYFHELTERRLEFLTGMGRSKEENANYGWRRFKILDVLDALAGL
jgi:hypothetical protein